MYQKTNIFFYLCILWLVLFFHNSLNLGLMADDAFNAQIRGKLIDEQTSLVKWYFDEFYGWLKGAGRIFIFSFHYAVISYFYNNIFFIRLIILFLFIFNTYLFYKFFLKISKHEYLSFLFVIALSSLIIFKGDFDPFISFFGKMAIIYSLLILSLIYYVDFLETDNSKKLKISFWIYVAHNLIYELSYFNFIFYYIIFLYYKELRIKNFFSLRLLVFPIFSILLVACSFILKTNFNPFFLFSDTKFLNTYPGGTLSFEYFTLSFKNNFLTIFSFLDISKLFSITFFQNTFAEYLTYPKYNIRVILVFCIQVILVIFIIYYLNKNLDKFYNYIDNIQIKKILLITLFGFFLILTQVTIISFSTSWQKKFATEPIGYVYMNHYGQIFGLSIILISLVIFSLRFANKKIFKIIINFIIILMMFTSINNFHQNDKFIYQLNKLYKAPPNLVTNAVENGIFRDVTENSIIIYKNRLPNDWYWFITSINKKIYEFCELKDLYQVNKCLNKKYFFKDFIKSNTKLNVKNYKIYAYRYFFKKNKGEVELYLVSQIYFGENNDIRIFSDEKIIFSEKKLLKKIKMDEINITDYFKSNINNSIIKEIYIDNNY